MESPSNCSCPFANHDPAHVNLLAYYAFPHLDHDEMRYDKIRCLHTPVIAMGLMGNKAGSRCPAGTRNLKQAMLSIETPSPVRAVASLLSISQLSPAWLRDVASYSGTKTAVTSSGSPFEVGARRKLCPRPNHFRCRGFKARLWPLRHSCSASRFRGPKGLDAPVLPCLALLWLLVTTVEACHLCLLSGESGSLLYY
jgi:hypothetical protein